MKYSGFTFIELIISIALAGVIMGMLLPIVHFPLTVYQNAGHSIEVMISAERILTQIARDVHSALPNSIRVSADGRALELVPIVYASHYRSSLPTTDADKLDFSTTDHSFNILAPYAAVYPVFAAHQRSPGNRMRAVIYNTGQYAYTNAGSAAYNRPAAGLNVYNPNVYTGSNSTPPQNSHVISPLETHYGLSDVGGVETRLTLYEQWGMPNEVSSGDAFFQFAMSSPLNRIYFIDTPVSYIYNDELNRLDRKSHYEFVAVQPTEADDIVSYGGGADSRLAIQVQDCLFKYSSGGASHAGVVIVHLELGEVGKVVHFFRQIQVQNAS